MHKGAAKLFKYNLKFEKHSFEKFAGVKYWTRCNATFTWIFEDHRLSRSIDFGKLLNVGLLLTDCGNIMGV